MILAFIADIHANAAALDAVLSDIPRTDAIICCGDIVGYYPDMNEVCAALRSRGVASIRGNHDAYITGALSPAPQNVEIYRTNWTRERLTAKHLDWLRALPAEMRIERDGVALAVRHASPWDEETYLHPDSPHLAQVSLETGELLVVGHTHRPMLKPAGDGCILNPGSVGQPRDGDPRASYALFDTATRQAEFRRVAYDVPAFQQRLRALDWAEALVGILSRDRRRR